MSISLYRKYRPEHFEDVVGQDHVIKSLKGALQKDTISHAYLFSGSRGIGKTSIARIFARELGTTSNDIYEIDAASNTGVDDIRELRESVRTLPLESPYKVYIIDEVHMLSKSAFNAFLKTLEEPPAHVIFMLATTEIHKLPDTVVSRCQTFYFKAPNQNLLKDVVLQTAEKEGVILDAAGAEVLALLGDGSFRDTHGMLEKVINGAESKNISAEDVSRVAGAPSRELVREVVSSVAYKQTERGLTALQKAGDENLDMSIFSKLIIQNLRNIILLRFSPMVKKDLTEELSEEDFQFIQEVSKDKAAYINSKVLERFLYAHLHISHTYLPQLPLELALIELTEESVEK